MPRILVVDDEAHVREVLTRALTRWGYEVFEAENGKDGLEKFSHIQPEVVLLDVNMPVMNGFEALKNLRQSPAGAATPVILVTTLPATEGEPIAMSLECQHYISKPFDLDVLRATIKVAVRESEANKSAAEVPTVQPPAELPGNLIVEEPVNLPQEPPEELLDELPEERPVTPPPAPSVKAMEETPRPETQPPAASGYPHRRLQSTGISMVDEELLGGIPTRSLTLIEGPPGLGKSTLCHHIALQALMDEEPVSYISGEESETSIIGRMSSLHQDQEVSAYYRRRQLRLECLEEPMLGAGAERSISLVGKKLREIAQKYQCVIIDSISNHAAYNEEASVTAFFRLCQRQCRNGRTICLVINSGIFDAKMWIKVRPLLDNHIRLAPKPMGRKLVKTLEVLKLNNVEVRTGNRIAFEVQKGSGILPIRITEFSV